ncbi:ubiquitin-like small modifier protein 1 [Salarchaeum sp. JOR-1]|uniref:ubiquitin-like small modifier protein 1 n=1 Tax=Salarchaeum sp. JOR-1 TaxID=2599399 RepID=UPI0011985BD8|nr:ubiquitin-like small modifier protein 1 [Salarchaeum sp. JOR-1]QDX39474.1 MoaD/ThiS family protein [Salarchaeum sp. JOR-1]
MELMLRFFANFRETVGQKTIRREYADGSTVGDVLRDLSDEHPKMELFDDDGSLREYLTVMKEGRDITYIDGLETELTDGDRVSVFPPVAGGSRSSPHATHR